MSSFYKFKDIEVYYAGAEGSPLPSTTKAPVIYDNIKKEFNKDNLFTDPDFPPINESIGIIGGDAAAQKEGKPSRNYRWCRPQEFCKSVGLTKPYFATVQPNSAEGADACSALDIMQGSMGDCWYMAAIAELTNRQEVLKVVIPEDNFNGFDDDNYCGAFHFRFYDMSSAKWVDIVIDDLLPADVTPNPPLPAFCNFTSIKRDGVTKLEVIEFWGPLLEKAYAKYIGSYAKIEGGYSSQAIENFTGGFSEIITLSEDLVTFNLAAAKGISKFDGLKNRISSYLEGGYFIGFDSYHENMAAQKGCLEGYSRKVPLPPVRVESEDGKFIRMKYESRLCGWKYTGGKLEIDYTKTGMGLVGPHAYSALEAVEVKVKDSPETVFLVKLRNPHAENEWIGRFSDGDDKFWGMLEKDLRVRDASGKTLNEGVFWIELRDIIRYFDKMEICLFGLDDTCKFTTYKSEWSEAIQVKSIAIQASSLDNFTAFKFECLQGRTSLARATEMENRCFVAFTIVIDGYHSLLKPAPMFMVYLFKVTEEDLDGRPLGQVYLRNPGQELHSKMSIGREVSEFIFIEPGTYVMVPALHTAPVQSFDGAMMSAISEELQGKPIPFTIRLYTENETTLTPIPPSRASKRCIIA